MPSQDSQQPDSTQKEHQPFYAEKGRKLPFWATALIAASVLVAVLACSTVVTFAAFELFSGRSPVNLFAMFEGLDEQAEQGEQEELSPPDTTRIITAPSSPEWETTSAAFADVMGQHNIPFFGSYGPAGVHRISSFVHFAGMRDGQEVVLAEFGSSLIARQTFEDAGKFLAEGQFKEITGIVSE